MHPLDTLAHLDLARQDHDRDRAVHDAAARRAAAARTTGHHARRHPATTAPLDPAAHP